MAKRKVRLVTFNKSEMDLDLPPVMDRRSLRRVGRGAAVIKALAERSRRTIVLEPDVFREFRTAREVNDALRLVQQLRHPARYKKSA